MNKKASRKEALRKSETYPIPFELAGCQFLDARRIVLEHLGRRLGATGGRGTAFLLGRLRAGLLGALKAFLGGRKGNDGRD